jgi:hypothetical protein
MVGTRKTPSGGTTVTLDGSPILHHFDDEDDTNDITDQLSVGSPALLSFLLADSSDAAQFNALLLRRHLC